MAKNNTKKRISFILPIVLIIINTIVYIGYNITIGMDRLLFIYIGVMVAPLDFVYALNVVKQKIFSVPIRDGRKIK